MVKNKSKLAIKLFIIVWVVLAVHIALKLTFNYWQPYIIPNEQLQAISDFIDANSIIKIIIDSIFYVVNGYLVICCCLKRWQLGKKLNIITLILLFIGSMWVVFIERNIVAIFLTIIFPLIIDKKKWLYVLLTFIFSNIFMILSLWLEGFVNSNDMQYICKVFLQFDYYIMLVLNYFVFNLFRKENYNGK